MKYIVIEEHEIDTFTEEFDNKEEAIKWADDMFSHLCSADRKRIKSYYILESVNSDEDADDHYDGDCIKIYK